MDSSQRGGDVHGSSAHPQTQLRGGTTRDDWDFLEPWIDVLEGRLTTYASDESSGSCSDDFWIEVQLRREEQLQIHQDGEQAAMSLLREAVVLVHLLGIANYGVWYEWLVVESSVYTPPQWFIPERDQVPMRYAFKFSEEHDDGFMNWDQSLAFLLGSIRWSDEFRRDFETAQTLLAKHGLSWEEREPIPVELRLFSEDFGDVDVSLKWLTRAVVEVENIERLARQETGQGLGLGVLFTIVQLDVDIGGETMTPLNFLALHELVRLGVPVGTLCLPKLPLTSVEEERLASLKDIVGFFRTILGLTADRGRPPTRVQQLVMPSSYGRTRWFAPFCSASASSRFLRVLHLVPQRTTGLASAGFGPVGTARYRAWSWLAFALFSSASSTSVESLVLNGSRLTDLDVDAIQAVLESSDPIAQLDTLPNEQARSGILANRFLAHRRASLELARTPVATRKRPHTQSRVSNSIINETPPQAKKQRVEMRAGNSHTMETGTSAFKTLSITSAHPNSSSRAPITDSDGSQYLRLLRLLGTRLRGLAIDSHELDHRCLPEILTLCPHLDSLDLRNASSTSLDIVRDIGVTPNRPLVSLQITSVCSQSGTLKVKLHDLLRPNKLNGSLTRLELEVTSDFGLTCALIQKGLSSNNRLAHLHLKVPSEEHRRFTRELQQKFHGQAMKTITSEDHTRRIAFFGVLQRIARRNPRLEINRDLKELVLQFATPVVRRRCVTVSTFKT